MAKKSLYKIEEETGRVNGVDPVFQEYRPYTEWRKPQDPFLVEDGICLQKGLFRQVKTGRDG
jgi:hypothetical protein